MNIYYEKDYIVTELCDNKRINLANAGKVQSCLTSIIQHLHTNVILDMHNIRFIDCEAINCLIRLTELAEENNSTFVLRNLSEHVQLLINTLQLSAVLHIEDNIKIKF